MDSESALEQPRHTVGRHYTQRNPRHASAPVLIKQHKSDFQHPLPSKRFFAPIVCDFPLPLAPSTCRIVPGCSSASATGSAFSRVSSGSCGITRPRQLNGRPSAVAIDSSQHSSSLLCSAVAIRYKSAPSGNARAEQPSFASFLRFDLIQRVSLVQQFRIARFVHQLALLLIDLPLE